MLTSSAEFQIEVIKDQSLLSEGQKSNFNSFLIENVSQGLYLCLNILKTADSFCHIVSHQDEALKPRNEHRICPLQHREP
jgi:hypothetical protein